MSAELRQVSEQIDQLANTTMSIKNQRDDARAALLDIIHGCDMYGPLTNGATAHFIAEVKRVAQGGLT